MLDYLSTSVAKKINKVHFRPHSFPKVRIFVSKMIFFLFFASFLSAGKFEEFEKSFERKIKTIETGQNDFHSKIF